jgi:hypothetical protein
MKYKLQQQIIDLLEEMLAYAEFDESDIDILRDKVERLRELKEKL